MLSTARLLTIQLYQHGWLPRRSSSISGLLISPSEKEWSGRKSSKPGTRQSGFQATCDSFSRGKHGVGTRGTLLYFPPGALDMAGRAWQPDRQPRVTGRKLLPLVTFLLSCASGPCHWAGKRKLTGKMMGILLENLDIVLKYWKHTKRLQSESQHTRGMGRDWRAGKVGRGNLIQARYVHIWILNKTEKVIGKSEFIQVCNSERRFWIWCLEADLSQFHAWRSLLSCHREEFVQTHLWCTSVKPTIKRLRQEDYGFQSQPMQHSKTQKMCWLTSVLSERRKR